MPRCQLVTGGIRRLDVAELVDDFVLVQPLSRLLAGRTLGVTDKYHSLSLHFCVWVFMIAHSVRTGKKQDKKASRPTPAHVHRKPNGKRFGGL